MFEPVDSEFGCFALIPRRPFVIHHITNAEETKKIGKIKSHIVVIIRDCKNSKFAILQNQRLASVYLIDCIGCCVQFLDSSVVVSKTVRIIDCVNCDVMVEDSDVRKIECFRSKGSKFKFVSSPTIVSNIQIYTRHGCVDSEVHLLYRPETIQLELNTISVSTSKIPDSDVEENGKQILTYFDQIMDPHSVELRTQDGKINASALKITERIYPFILRVLARDTIEESFPTADTVLEDLKKMESTPFDLTDEELSKAFDLERMEYEETDEEIIPKIKQFAVLLKESKHCVAFTGAGISTSADIPDFRGPQGIWTARDTGRSVADKKKQLNEAQPTYAHYSITELVRRGLIKFCISTNMDCLHIRSGLPKHLIVEQHGNCHKEVCVNCGQEYWRAYDTTTTVLRTRDHFTCRYCTWCGGKLRDTIVHFSENWSQESTEPLSLYHSRKTDLALILGTSMNVQPNATFPEECRKKANPGKMVIVNLQKTPYDHLADIRIFAKTDKFMYFLMRELGMEDFKCAEDPRDQWDKLDESDLERYYELAYVGYKKKKAPKNPDTMTKLVVLLLPLILGCGTWGARFFTKNE